MFIELSYPIEQWSPGRVLGIPAPQVKARARFGDGQGKANQTSIIELSSHNGTHVDTAWHVLPDGRKLGDYALSDFVFDRAVIIHCAKEDNEPITAEDISFHFRRLDGCDLLLVYTGFSQYRARDTQRYVLSSPYFTTEAAEYIVNELPTVRCVGADTFGVEAIAQGRERGWPVHKAFFAATRPFLLVEDMNLSPAFGRTLRRVIVAPLRISEIEASPATVLADVE